MGYQLCCARVGVAALHVRPSPHGRDMYCLHRVATSSAIQRAQTALYTVQGKCQSELPPPVRMVAPLPVVQPCWRRVIMRTGEGVEHVGVAEAFFCCIMPSPPRCRNTMNIRRARMSLSKIKNVCRTPRTLSYLIERQINNFSQEHSTKNLARSHRLSRTSPSPMSKKKERRSNSNLKLLSIKLRTTKTRT